MKTAKAVVLQVTTQCEHVCPHCFLGSRPGFGEQIKISQIRGALENLKSAGINKVSEFIFTGGEPTTWQPLKEAVFLIRKKYPLARIRIDTNGFNFFKNPSLFGSLGADLYHLSVDSFHNQGIIDKKEIYKDIYVDSNGKSKIANLFIKKSNEFKFGLFIRWTSNRQDDKLFDKFCKLYRRPGVVISKKLVTATGRAKNLSSRELKEGYLIEENQENFQCLMGNHLILAANGYWHACYHPVPLTKICKSGSKLFVKNFKIIRQSYLYKNLPKKGFVKVLDYIKKKNPELIEKIDEVLATRYWYRCEPCEKLCSMKIFKR